MHDDGEHVLTRAEFHRETQRLGQKLRDRGRLIVELQAKLYRWNEAVSKAAQAVGYEVGRGSDTRVAQGDLTPLFEITKFRRYDTEKNKEDHQRTVFNLQTRIGSLVATVRRLEETLGRWSDTVVDAAVGAGVAEVLQFTAAAGAATPSDIRRLAEAIRSRASEIDDASD